MNRKLKRIIVALLSVCMVFSGLHFVPNAAMADTLANVANNRGNYTFMTSNANTPLEGFLYVGKGFSAINTCNENLGNGNNMLGKTATTDEAAIYVDLGNNYDISSALIYQGSTNNNFFDSYCRSYQIYYSTEQVSAANEGNISWNLAGACDNGTIYSGAKIKNAEYVSDSGDQITFDNTYTARSVKIVFDKESCMGTGTSGNNTGTTGTVSLLSVRVYGVLHVDETTTEKTEETITGETEVTSNQEEVTTSAGDNTLYGSHNDDLALKTNHGSVKGYASSNLRNGSTTPLTVNNLTNGNTTGTNYIIANTPGDANPWFAVDLGSVHDINKVIVTPGADGAYPNAYPVQYKIQVAAENTAISSAGQITGLTWKTVATVTNGTMAAESLTFPRQNARYVRVLVDSYANYCSLYELSVYETDDTVLWDGEDDMMNVLFIGNSFTYYNTVCNVVKGLAEYNGHNITVTAATNGGQDLVYQSTAENVLNAIKVGGYDVVILQDKVGSNFQESTLMNGSEAIIPIIKQYSPDAKLVYYEPWPTKDQIESKMSYFTSSYINAAKKYNASLAPAGEGFYELYANDGLDYYCSDNRHPQPLGTFNSASTIYYALYPDDAYRVYTESDHTYLNNLINSNVAYTSEGKLDSYSLEILNKITSYGYKYAHAVIPAVNGTGTYTSVADGGKVENPTGGTPPETTTKAEDLNMTDVLFIGNSMTYYNNLCNVVQGIATRKGHNVKCSAATNGGQNLIYQSTAANVLNAIKKGGYEVVVLQDIVGGFDSDKLQSGADTIIPIIKQYNPDAKIIFYEPWPTKDTITGTAGLLPYFTYSYIQTAKSAGASLAPAGEAFYELFTQHNKDYYCGDNKHPQVLGTFTSAAAVYYAMYPDEAYEAFTSADQSYLDNLINTNVAYTNEGRETTYSLETLNLIFSLGYKYSQAVIPAVSGNDTYTSVGGTYTDPDAGLNPDGLKPVQGEIVNADAFTKANGNMAVGCQAYASNEKQSASYAVDGNTGTRWETESADPQWLYVDLGEKKDINKVGFMWEGAYAAKYYVQVSDDANEWKTVAVVNATTNKNVQIDLGQTYNTRYVRMYGTKRGTGYGYSFYEMGIWNMQKEEETTRDPSKPEIVVKDTVRVEGYQISTVSEGSRVIGSVEPVIDGKKVSKWGFVYAIIQNGNQSYAIEDDDMYVGNDNPYIASMESTDVGTLSVQMGNSTTATYFARTTLFSKKNVAEFNAKYKVRAYALMEDGTYYYSNVSAYRVFDVAKILYDEVLMKNFSGHEYLYNNILKVVDSTYKEVDYDWKNVMIDSDRIQ